MSSSSTRLPTSFSSYRAPSRRTPTQNHPPPPTPPHRGRRGRARAGCQQRASVDSSAYYLPRTRVRRRVSVLPTLQLSSSCCPAASPGAWCRSGERGAPAQLQTGFKRLCSKFYSYSYSKAYLSNIPYFIAQFLIDYPPISPITRYFNTLSTQYYY